MGSQSEERLFQDAAAKARESQAGDADVGAEMTAGLADVGYVHIKGFVPANEIGELRRLITEFGSAGNIHKTPIFSYLVERLQAQKIVRSYVGDEVFYFGWCTCMPGVKARPGGLHDDAKGVPIAVDAPRSSLFSVVNARSHDAVKHPLWPVYRLFIYLDDHAKFSGGTKVRSRSHRRYGLFTREGLKALGRLRFKDILIPGLGYQNPRVRPGDALLFNLKCKHAGHFLRLRWPLDRLSLPVSLDNFIKRLTLRTRIGRWVLSLFAQEFHEKRTSVSIDFCTDSDWSRGYQIERLLHPNNRMWQQQFFDCNSEEFTRRLDHCGLPVLRNPHLRAVEGFVRETE